MWLSAIFFIVSFYYFRHYTFNFLMGLMFILIFIGGRYKLPITERIGILLYFVMLLGLFRNFVTIGTMSLSHQPLYAQILIAEVYLSLWLFKPFYDYFLPGHNRTFFTKTTRFIFNFVFPFAVIYLVNRRFPDYLAYALWGTVLTNFIFVERTKNKTLLAELYMLIVLSTFLAFWYFDYFSIFSGIVVLAGIVVYKGGYKNRIKGTPKYRYIPGYTYFYLGTVIFFTMYFWLNIDIVSELFVLAFYFYGLVFFRKHIFPVRTMPLLTYRMAYLFLIAAVYLFFTNELEIRDYWFSNRTLQILLMPMGFGFLHLILYQKWTTYPGKNHGKRWRLEIRFLHILYIFSYIAVVKFLTKDYTASWVTVISIIHGIFLVLAALRPYYSFLTKFGILLLALALFKLFYHDLRDYTITQRVVVFILVGSMFLVAAFFYVRKKEKLDNKTNENKKATEATEKSKV